jgi:hypothetical protein
MVPVPPAYVMLVISDPEQALSIVTFAVVAVVFVVASISICSFIKFKKCFVIEVLKFYRISIWGCRIYV